MSLFMLVQKPNPNICLFRDDDGLNNNSNGYFFLSAYSLAQEANDMNIKNTHKCIKVNG